MRQIHLPTWRALMMVITSLSPIASWGQKPPSPAAPSALTALAMRYLRSIDNTNSFDSLSFIFVGTSRPPSDGWRVIVICGDDNGKARLMWDAFSLAHDKYRGVIGLNDIDEDADGPNGYLVTLRGCAPHQCADGRIGFALYASQTRRTYTSHITTRDDGSYDVTYYPKSDMPDTYRDKLDQMMCSDNGVSRPSTLPIKCSAQ